MTDKTRFNIHITNKREQKEPQNFNKTNQKQQKQSHIPTKITQHINWQQKQQFKINQQRALKTTNNRTITNDYKKRKTKTPLLGQYFISARFFAHLNKPTTHQRTNLLS